MKGMLKKIVTCLFISLTALPAVSAQVPLGVHGEDRELLSLFDFGNFGKKITELDDQVKFRRHVTSHKPLKFWPSSEENSHEDRVRTQEPGGAYGINDPFVQGVATRSRKVNRTPPVIKSKPPVARSRLTRTRVKGNHLKKVKLSEFSDIVVKKPLSSRRQSRNGSRYRTTDTKTIHRSSKRKPEQPNGSSEFEPVVNNLDLATINRNKRIRKPQAMEKLVTDQFKRVVKTAHNLNIKTGMENPPSLRNAKEIMIVSPKGSPDAGSLAYIRFRPISKPSFDFGIMKGPYEDAYHRQIYNNYDRVLELLGQPAKDKATPDMNSILSNIVLKTDWDIKRV